MNAQHAAQSRSANGYGRRRVDRDIASRMETKTHTGKSVSGSFSNAGLFNGGKVGGLEGPTRDRLIYVTTCLVGHYVEAHVKNGSIISGIFHAANVEKDFGIVLKMARIIKDGSVKGPNLIPETIKKPQTVIIPARELVQVIAKDLPLGADGSVNGNSREKRQDLMIDSAISHSHHMEAERELQPWMPDEDDPGCPELENIFNGTWNRNWDQFETNKNLFGVKSTFDEELYTTKLERGPQMKELEREALRLAREIEGEETGDLHLAEERGFDFHDDLGLDEETRFSAVRREVNDGRFEEDEDANLDTHNAETFGGTSSSLSSRSYSDGSMKKILDENQASTVCSSMGDEVSDRVTSDEKELQFGFSDHASQLEHDFSANKRQSLDDDKGLDECQTKSLSEDKGSSDSTARTQFKSMQASSPEEVQTAISTTDLSPTAAAYSPAQESKHHVSDLAECSEVSTTSEAANSCWQPGGTASTSERLVGSVSTGRGISPSSSVGSLSSEKSTLNPNAKEFKLNPNAKSFTPSSSLKPHAPSTEGAFYYASNIAAVPDMHGVPMGIGIGPAFSGHQPVVYNPQLGHMPTQPAYMPGPLYGQHVINGQPRPGFYVPAYPNEMMYKGRNF